MTIKKIHEELRSWQHNEECSKHLHDECGEYEDEYVCDQGFSKEECQACACDCGLDKLITLAEKAKDEKSCPWCGSPLELIGSAGILDADGRWDLETDRYRCPEGHMVFVGHSDVVDLGENE